MKLIGRLETDQAKALLAAGKRINFVRPRYSNVVTLPRRDANQVKRWRDVF